jgi:osmotically-inducible protein OsmY
MNLSSKKRIWVMCAYLAPVLAGSAGFATAAGAQNLVASAVTPSQSTAGSSGSAAAPGANVTTDQELRARVQAALHSDPYFYDGHVSVSVDKGVVSLHGIVFSDWDLHDALRIAWRAAGQNRVVDDLSIEMGGQR